MRLNSSLYPPLPYRNVVLKRKKSAKPGYYFLHEKDILTIMPEFN